MIKARNEDKALIVGILHAAFIDILQPNSINYTIKNDTKRYKRLQILMEYQFDIALKYGEIFYSENKKGCILYIDATHFSFKKLVWEVRLVLQCIGIENVFKIYRREKLLKTQHPKEQFKHLWLLGVPPPNQREGIGSKLVQETLQKYKGELIYVETTTSENLQFYQKNGFKIFHKTFELNYPLYFLNYV